MKYLRKHAKSLDLDGRIIYMDETKSLLWLKNAVNIILGFALDYIFLYLVFWKKTCKYPFFVSYIGNVSLMFYFDLKISIVLLQFVKSLLRLYIENTAICNSIKFTVSQTFLLPIDFENIFSLSG